MRADPGSSNLANSSAEPRENRGASRRIRLAAVSALAMACFAGAAVTSAQEFGSQRGFDPFSQAPYDVAQARAGGDILGYGESFLAVGTRTSQATAVVFANEYAGDFPTVAVARLRNGKWATLIGIVDTQSAQGLMKNMRNTGRIPNGSYLLTANQVSEIVWTKNGEANNEALQLPVRVPNTSILAALGIAGNWAGSTRYCSEPADNGDLLESRMQISPRAMQWGSFGSCQFGSIVRVAGGVYLDATCGSGDKRESFVIGLRRQGTTLNVITDPGEKHKLSYTLRACGRINTPIARNTIPGATLPRQDNPRVARVEPPRGNSNPADPDVRPPGKARSTGSGFFVTATGHIVTNQHVIRACERVFVTGYGEAQMVNADAHNDLALLKVTPKKPVPYVKVRTKPAELGQDVVVFGFPLATFLANGLNVTTGIISADIGMHSDKRMLQFTAAIQPGNSGGPVVDRAGNLIAVVRSKMSDKYAMEKGSFVPQGLNYGIKTDVLLKFLGSNRITAETANAGENKTVAELAAQARDHTLLVTCHGNTASASND